MRGRQEGQSQRRGDVRTEARERALCYGAMTQGMRGPPEAGKGEETYCPPRPPKETMETLVFSWAKLTSDF